MKRVLIILLAALFVHIDAHAANPSGDTLSKAYLDATANWLYGRPNADRTLRSVAAQSLSANERESAKELLLEELYFWPGHYHQYIRLADSMGYQSPKMELAHLLIQQPPQRVYLSGDSLLIPFELKNKAHIVVTVLINGKPVRLAVDTGASQTLISNRMARRIGLRKLVGVDVNNYHNRTVSTSLAMADSLQLGGLTVRNLPVLFSSVPIPGIDGLLGWDLLRQFALVIDYPKQTLTLCRSVPDTTLPANLLGGSQPMLSLPGPAKENLLLQLDTGSNESLRLSPLGLTKIGPYKTGRKLGFSKSVGKRLQIRWEKLVRKLTLDVDGKPQSFRHSAGFDSDSTIGQFIRDGLIGGRAFRTGRLTLDAPNHHYSYVPQSQ